MATNATVTVSYVKTIDNVKSDSLSQALSIDVSTALIRFDVSVASSAAETDYLPASVSTVNFLLVTSADNDVLLRTVTSGTQYTVPGEGAFLVQSSGVTNILLTGNGSTNATVTIIVGQT